MQYLWVFPLQDSRHSTFLEIHFTKLADLTTVHSSVSLLILHPNVLYKKYMGMDFRKKLHSKALHSKALIIYALYLILYRTNSSLVYNLQSTHSYTFR